jgi:hypothetical protein
MKEKPVLFSTPMIRALLNTKPGAWPPEPVDASKPFKWMTRRVIVPQPKEGWLPFIDIPPDMGQGIFQFIQCMPKYKAGQILWVREAFCTQFDNTGSEKEYLADWYNKNTKTAETIDLHGRTIHYLNPYGFECPRWRPSIFMPREAARIFLEVKAVRVERAQETTEEDAKAEGVLPINPFDLKQMPNSLITPGGKYGKGYILQRSFKAGYYQLWDILNAKRGYSWESNPYVYVYEFRRIK